MNLNRVNLKMSAGQISQFPREPLPQVALAGRSNVGKSSLINTLLGRKSLARVSSSPGKTVTINFYDVDNTMYLVDLPGYGYARRSREEQQVWSKLTDGYFSKNPQIDRLRLVVQLVDIRVGLTQDDRDMIGYLTDAALPFVVVATKIDKLSKTELQNKINLLIPAISEAARGATDNVNLIPFSSLTGVGKDELWNVIGRAIK